MSDFSLIVKLAADTSAFDSGMKKAATEARQWASEAKQIFTSTRTPAEQYRAAVDKVHDAWRTGRIDTETFARALRKLNDEMTVTATMVPKATAPMAGLGKALSGSMLGFSSAVGAAVVGAQMAVQAIESLGHAAAATAIHGLKLAAEFEQAEVAFGTVFKSATAAKNVMAEIQQFAAATPFEFPELKDAAVKLAGFGTSAQQVVPTLKMLGDIAAGTGTTVGELAETYGKARVQGRAYTRDVNEFANRGVPIWEALAKTLGTTKDKIHGMVEEGKVGFPELQRALVSLTQEGGMYEGATERQSKTLMGLYSTLRDNVNLTLADIGASITKELSLKEATKEVIEFTGVIKNELTPTIIEFAKGAAMLSKGTEPLLRMMSGLDTFKASVQASHEAMLRWKLVAASVFGGGGATDLGAKHFLELAELQRQREGASGSVGPVQIENDVGKESRDLAEAAAAFNAKLKDQIATMGMASEEAELYKLKQQGLKGEALATAEALIKQKRAQDELVKSQSAVKSHIDALQLQADTFKMSAKEADLYKQALAGATAQQLEEIAAIHDKIEEQREEAKAEKEREAEAERQKKELQDFIDAERKAQKADADRIKEMIKSPAEKLDEQIARIQELADAGELTKEEAEAARRKLEGEFLSETGNENPERTSENRALLRGTAEAFSAVNRANDKKKQEKILEDQLTIQKRQEIIQRQQLAAQQNVARWN